MSAGPLPSSLDVRKAAAREASCSGTVAPQELPRLRAMLAGDDGVIDVRLNFLRDEQERAIVKLVVSAELSVTCQRCLETMREHIESATRLAVVWSDEEAAVLPRDLDPLVVVEPELELRELVEDELILAMPAFSYHEKGQCTALAERFSGPAEPAEKKTTRRPFEGLADMVADGAERKRD